MVVLTVGHEYVGGIRGSGTVSSAAHVLGKSVVREVGGVCKMCTSLARVGVGSEGVKGLGSILLYLIDICFLPCICLWQI